MSDTPEPPPAKAHTVDLRVAHLTRAVAQSGEIRFELHAPDSDPASVLADNLSNRFFLDMSHVPGERFGPISVDEDRRDKAKVVIVYKPDSMRDRGRDMREMVQILAEEQIPMTPPIVEGIREAFDALKALSAPGHASAEASRRSVKREPRGTGSR